MRKFRPRVRGGPVGQTIWMQISDDQIDDFITTWENAFNEGLTRDVAKTKAAALLELFTLLANRPLGAARSAPPETGDL